MYIVEKAHGKVKKGYPNVGFMLCSCYVRGRFADLPLFFWVKSAFLFAYIGEKV